ncbi:hypothetical protein ACFO4P_09815 [Epilithonimonas pallida]|uniref:Apea-like HEPN domain-containing protein n=1 Tax=Epilithonimonas pallida TaxID=373671 RepID=A0ABY1R4D8_9FLAO|nr:hypothetical protein [Epilithonimonas pallida]SMP93056.1 hypothetical protein SAMN05421679_104271 [Epilithonimonas pallida]
MIESVESIYNTYISNLNSVNLYFNKFGKLATNEDENISDTSSKFLFDTLDEYQSKIDKIKLEIGEDKEEEIIKISHRHLRKVSQKLKKRTNLSPKNYEILSNSSFLMLNNYFEYLLTDLLSYYYNKYSNSLNEKEFKFTLKELSEYESIQEAIKDLIIKEVESLILEKSFNDLLSHFEDKLKISLEKDLIKWENIIEIRERRHLIVHNSSIVNKKYIVRTKNPYNFKIGDKITIDKIYFLNSLKEFKLAGQLLLFNCWGNWDKDKINEAINEIMVQSFEDLKAKNYDIVSKTCKYAEIIIPKNSEQEDFLLRIKINHALALKRTNDKKLTDVLKTIKVGTATPIFKVAHKILSNDLQDIENEIKKAIILEELNQEQYLEWPLFDEIRNIVTLDEKISSYFIE